ncbi:hypothetical protein SAY87_008594 [Trapa incisa]|uniref:U5 small nuclear ribonucleoprotein TSSC4 n=1 Tax=Trapa incisa TaxID=236973 RepID=A0AAN7JXI4_9MYRT|nr:hypothetical protein SAY87_008594 [Trapa incisa]
MEDTFKVRVDRIFGSLNAASAVASASPDSSLRSLWSLTDDEIERKEWNRDKGSPEPEFVPECMPNVSRIMEEPSHGLREMENDLVDLEDGLEEDEDDDEPSSRSGKPDDYNDEEWEIKSSIGRDCTLDYEEEEDVYDKVAVGREKVGERLYMKDFCDYGIEIDSGNELPSSFGDADRDLRANRMAAEVRLREDAEAAGEHGTLTVLKGNANLAARSWINPPEDDRNLKSILKRKDGQMDSKSRKRVRFDAMCISEAPAMAEDVHMETGGAAPVPSRVFSSAVPDYIRNPSRYTHYTFDSASDMDEQSNRQAYMDILKILKRSKNAEDEAPGELPSSVIFVPRKRRNGDTSNENDADSQVKVKVIEEAPNHRRGIPVGIAIEDDQESETCSMEEDDETEPAVNEGSSSRKAGRHYRVKATLEVDE